MNFSYRTRRVLTTLGIIAMILILLAVAVWAIWLLWLDRYVVYTRDGAKIDFNLSLEYSGGQEAKPPEQGEQVDIYYNEGDNELNTSTELGKLTGYYASAEMLTDTFELVQSQVYLLEAQTPVMIDLKDPSGYFYYNTELGKKSNLVNTDEVEELIEYMNGAKLYLIARIPSFRDYLYAVDKPAQGLTHSSGRYVFSDDDHIYWLDPTNQSVLNRLVKIVDEIKALGFDEVVFDDFWYPDTTKIMFKGSRRQALADASVFLTENCATGSFAVSFTVDNPTFTLPEGRTRLYMENQSAGDAKKLTEQSGLEEPTIHLVFVTEVNDTRFDDFSVLRPITAAQLEGR